MCYRRECFWLIIFSIGFDFKNKPFHETPKHFIAWWVIISVKKLLTILTEIRVR
jgi:hypothetical protein